MPSTIARIVEDTSRAYRCSGKVNYIEQVPPVLNDKMLTGFVADVSDGLLGHHNRTEPAPMTYGEDFAEYLRFAKGCFFWLGSGPQLNADRAAGMHSPRFNPDERCISIGAAMMAGNIFQRLEYQP